MVAAVAARLGPHALAGEGFERWGCDARPAQVVVAGVTCGDASYSLKPPKIPEPQRQNLEKCSDWKGKGLPKGVIT